MSRLYDDAGEPLITAAAATFEDSLDEETAQDRDDRDGGGE